MKTRLDVINRAFRRIGVRAEDETLTADQIANGGEVLDTLFEEVDARAQSTFGAGLPFTVDSVPESAFLPLANLLAAEIAGDYGQPVPVSRQAATLQLLSVMFPDDRETSDPAYF